MIAYPLTAHGALCDPASTERYFSVLFRHVDWATGQCFSLLGIGEKGTPRDGSDGKRPFQERKIIAPAFMGSAHAHIRRWGEHHVAAFIVPAVLHADAGEAGDVKLDKVAALTAIILDLDKGEITRAAQYAIDRLGKPTMTVASGGKTAEGEIKRHLYWLLNEPSDDVERVAALRKLLAAKVGGDQSFGRATQVIRIPGSVHAKNGVPNRCMIMEANELDYSLDDLAEIIDVMEPMPGLPEPAAPKTDLLTVDGWMDFSPRQDTAVAALHRDVHEGGDEITRWGEFSKVAGFYIAEARAGRILPQAAYDACLGWMNVHMVPPWPQARFDQEFNALVRKDIENHGQFPQAVVARAEAPRMILPTPATWPMPSAIPPRPWLFGRWLQRGIVTAMVAPGGVGKSSLVASVMLSLATGKPILGKHVYGGPLRAWYWNLEDNGDNLARSRVAAAMHYRISEEECGDRMFVDSGPDGAELCMAVESREGFSIIEPIMEAVTQAIRGLGIDVLIIDPFVSSHAVNENDNNKIDAVAKRWARVAQDANCSIVLVHHTTKMRGEKVTAESSRGAGALNNAARMTLVLNRMTDEQADAWGIEHLEALRYFTVSDDKHNLSPAERADWYRLVSVDLGNGTETLPADNIGVVTPWEPPQVMDGVTVDDLYAIQRAINGGTYWRDFQTKVDWAGDVVGEVLKIDSTEKQNRKRIKDMLDIWIRNGALKPDMVRDGDKRRLREAVVVGHWVSPTSKYVPGDD